MSLRGLFTTTVELGVIFHYPVCGFGPRKQGRKIKIDTGSRPVGLLLKWATNIARFLGCVTINEYDRKEEFVLLVQPVQNLSLRNGHRTRSNYTSFHFNVPR